MSTIIVKFFDLETGTRIHHYKTNLLDDFYN